MMAEEVENKNHTLFSLKYQKLVVPSRMRSSFWKFFGFPASEDGEIISRHRIVCVLCKSSMIYHKNTTNLRNHLHTKHKNALALSESQQSDSFEDDSLATNTENSIENASPKVVKYSEEECSSIKVKRPRRKRKPPSYVEKDLGDESYSCDQTNIPIITYTSLDFSCEFEEKAVSEAETFHENILNFVVNSFQSPSIVEESSFIGLISAIQTKDPFPSRQYLTEELIPNKYSTCKSLVTSSIATASGNLGLTVEEWVSCDKIKQISLYLHYNSQNQHVVNLLLTVPYDEEYVSFQEVSNTLKSTFDEFGIDPSLINSVVTPNFELPTLMKVFENLNLIIIPCFLKTVNEAVEKACLRRPEVSEVLNKCNNFISYCIYLGVNVEESATEGANASEALFCDIKNWSTTYDVLKSLQNKRLDFEMRLEVGTDFEKHYLSSSDWCIVDAIISVMFPLKELFSVLKEEDIVSASIIHPLLIRLTETENWSIGGGDTKLISDMKLSLKNYLTAPYQFEPLSNFLKLASYCDPRFKEEYSIQQCDIEVRAKRLIVKIMEAELADDSMNGDEHLDSSPMRKSGMTAIFGTSSQSRRSIKTIEERAELEITQYQVEKSVPMETNVTEWWSHSANKFPALWKLASRFFAIPAISVTPQLLDNNELSRFEVSRSRLNNQLANMVTFLQFNEKQCLPKV